LGGTSLYILDNIHFMNNEDLVNNIEELRSELSIPGVSVGVYRKDTVFTKGFGVTNLLHPLEVDENTLFQIGSITKTFVGTMSMMLVEKGKLGLDEPIRTYLPDFKVMDQNASSKATIRHLFTHAGGWIGDWFPSGIDQGPDAIKRYVETMKDAPQVTPLGEHISYNNAGYNLAGRILEVVTGRMFSELIKEMIFMRLDMNHSYILPWDIMTHRFASGHHLKDDSAEVATPWFIGRCSGPAGGIITCVKDMLNYIRFQLGDGTYKGKRLLSEESLEALHTPNVYYAPSQSIGLTFWVDDYRSVRALRHGGGTVGQASLLTIVPEKEFGIIVVSNSEQGRVFRPIITNYALESYLGVKTPQPEILRIPEDHLEEYVGEYKAKLTEVIVGIKDGKLTLSQKSLGGFPTEDQKPKTMDPSPPTYFGFYEKDYIIGIDKANRNTRAQFIRDEYGKISFIRANTRLHRRK
jgi:CubicO group peptidase (beta-lactamase class C family)